MKVTLRFPLSFCTNQSQRWMCLLVIAIVCCGFATPMQAFDTGHHHDLTASAMKSLGFNATAIQVAQVENWLVDYYSNQPVAGLSGDLEKLHFDNLLTHDRIAIYWSRLRANSKSAFENAATAGDALQIVALLGMSLHAVQDFYTHSNWVEEHTLPATGFLTDSYFDSPAIAGHPTLRTGHYPNHNPLQPNDHGDGQPGSAGMNHDSYARARWNQAYVYGFCASRQWIEAVRTWVQAVPNGNAVWNNALNLGLTAAQKVELAADSNAAYRISEYAPGGGHWKGLGSESRVEFGAATAAFVTSPDSTFVKHFKVSKWHKKLTDGLEITTAPPAAPAIPRIRHPYVALQVQTVSVAELPVGLLESKIDIGGKADFYAKVAINGQDFTESMQLDRDTVTPHWNSMAFVPDRQADVSIRYELWDEDGGVRGDDDQCDILSAAGNRALEVTYKLATEVLSGHLSGIHNTPATAVESSGKLPDKDRARVKLMFVKGLLAP